MFKPNDLILRTTTALIAFILLGFSIYLLLAGHNSPGGGFVGGLMTSSAILLMYMAYGMEFMERIIIVNFPTLIITGLLIAVTTGVISLFLKEPFLSHTFGEITLPILGQIELATAMVFDIGVFLTVLGVTITIILTIAQDQGDSEYDQPK